MSLSLTAVQQTHFESLVKAAYESKGKNLIATVRQRTGFSGRFIQFTKVGFVISILQAYQDTVTLQDPNYTKVDLVVNKFVTPVGTDIAQNTLVNFDDRAENVMLVVDGVRRRQDQLIIDSMASAVLPAPNVIPEGGTGLTYEKVKKVNKLFNKNNVPRLDRHFLITADAEEDLLNEAQFTDNDFVNKGAVRTGSLDGAFALGLNFHVIGDMPEGGLPLKLPLPSTTQRNFAYARSAVGFGMNEDFGTRVDYLPKETTWLINGIHQSGAVAIDVIGIVEVETLIA